MRKKWKQLETRAYALDERTTREERETQKES